MGPSAGPPPAPPRLGRLKRRPEFLRVAAAGRRCSTPGVLVQAEASRDAASPEAPPRVGFTVSRKVGGAVVRNRAKRRLRAVAAELLPALGQPATDYVLIGRQATPTRPYALLKADLAEALRRLANSRGKPR